MNINILEELIKKIFAYENYNDTLDDDPTLLGFLYNLEENDELKILIINRDDSNNFGILINNTDNMSIEKYTEKNGSIEPTPLNEREKCTDPIKLYIITNNFYDRKNTKMNTLKKLLKNSYTKIVLDNIIYIPKKQSSDIELNTGGRLGTNHIKNKIDDLSIPCHIFSVSVYDLYELYKSTGESLFDENLRIGISDVLNVNKSIEETLENEPSKFWLYNNGITMVANQDDFDCFSPDKIRFKKNKLSNLSIINGAQTLTTISSCISKLENDPDKNVEKIENIKKEAKVLLKVIEFEGKGTEKDVEKNIKSAISVALNRQKPILANDIAITLQPIRLINEFYNSTEENELSHYKFNIARRGESSSIEKKIYDLLDFSKIVYAIFEEKVASARSKSRNELLAVDPVEKNEFKNLKYLNIQKNTSKANKNSKKSNQKSNQKSKNINNYDEISDFFTKLIPVNFLFKIFEIINKNKNNNNIKPEHKYFFSYGNYHLLHLIFNLYCEKHGLSLAEIKSKDLKNKFKENKIIFETSNNNIEIAEVLLENIIKYMKDIEEIWKNESVKEGIYNDSNAFKKDDYYTTLYTTIKKNDSLWKKLQGK